MLMLSGRGVELETGVRICVLSRSVLSRFRGVKLSCNIFIVFYNNHKILSMGSGLSNPETTFLYLPGPSLSVDLWPGGDPLFEVH